MSTKLEACIFSITLNLTIKFGLNQQSDDPTWHLLGPLFYPIINKLEILHANSVRVLLFFFKKSDKKIRSLGSVRKHLSWLKKLASRIWHYKEFCPGNFFFQHWQNGSRNKWDLSSLKDSEIYLVTKINSAILVQMV